MAMKLVIPVAPKGGGGNFTDRFKPTGSKFTIRVIPFEHEDQTHLAAVDVVHFTGKGQAPQPCTGSGCVICAEASAKKDKRLRRVTRFPIVVIDIDADEKDRVPLRYDCPSSLYSRICALCEDDPDTVLGPKGMDIIVKHDNDADPANQYIASLRLKGSEVIKVNPDDVPDLIKEVADNRDQVMVEQQAPGVAGGKDEVDEDLIQFKDPKTKKMKEGKDTGKRRGKMLIVEVDGHLVSVDPDTVVPF